MKYFSKLFSIATLAIILLAACDKVGSLPFYGNGTAPALSSTSATIAPVPADSLKPAVTFNWTFPGYATDSANHKYVVEIAPAGSNFANSAKRIVNGSLSTTYSSKEINDILLGYGYNFGTPYNMEVRVTSSYKNNNEQLGSNTVPVKMTPYKVPPKVPLPTTGKLFLVGSASDGGWSNPVPVPSQEFARLDETTFAGVFHLTGGKEYLVLPLNGSWDSKFSIADNTKPGVEVSGSFGFNLSSNFTGPVADGVYKIVLDFQSGTYTVAEYKENNLPTNLFLVGDATPGGWANPVPVPSQQFTRLNSVEWEISIDLNGGKEYLILPENGSWSNKYSVADNSIPGLSSGGDFGYNKPQNFPGPQTSGSYKIKVNFATSKFTVN